MGYHQMRILIPLELQQINHDSNVHAIHVVIIPESVLHLPKDIRLGV